MTLRRKSRHLSDLNDQIGSGTLTIWTQNKSDGAIGSLQSKSRPMGGPAAGGPRGYQYTDSENHPEWMSRQKAQQHLEDRRIEESLFTSVGSVMSKGSIDDSSAGDVGGEFLTMKTTVTHEGSSSQHVVGKVDMGSYYWVADYRGPVLPSSLSGLGLAPTISLSNLAVMGTHAIAKCSPVNQLAVALADFNEIRQSGLPKLLGAGLWKDRVLKAKTLGGEYLNKEFGWDPLVADIKSVALAAANAGAILEQLQRDSGKVVRRQYGFPVEETQSVTLVGSRRSYLGDYAGAGFSPSYLNGDPLEILYYGGSSGALYRERHTYKRVWFSGAFTYHVPWGYNSHNRVIRDARRAQTLIGLDFTPEALWAATPWTWALGWFSNSGDVVHNLSAWSADGQVLKYGYMMETQTIKDTFFITNRGQIKDPNCKPSKVVVSVEMKRRVKATPFGFEITWLGFSPQQVAISVALGLTKGVLKFPH